MKTMTAKVTWAQVRRIRCESCREPFVFLHHALEKFESYGVPVLSSNEGMNEGISKKARKRLTRLAASPRLGAAVCPHCGRYQKWMILWSRVHSLTVWGGAAFAFAAFFGLVAAIKHQPGDGILGPVLTFLAIMGVGIGIGWARSLAPGVRRDRKDPHSIRDEEFHELLVHCRRIDGDPVTEWFLSMYESAPKGSFLVSVGCEDFTGEEFFPPKWTSGSVLGQP